VPRSPRLVIGGRRARSPSPAVLSLQAPTYDPSELRLQLLGGPQVWPLPLCSMPGVKMGV
jgi:hypothetical protein